ncbi:hypothetical protein HHK36_030726 [Tetracentron sinense]|uniref:CCHC-type domain-containing protein n=1 Tax=Tetracentron sinense TaxID=13715 RepID=A0A834YDC1_TETSI|nr:hypothetical protein HHK36_030726 [Tetracentron sinense]
MPESSRTSSLEPLFSLPEFLCCIAFITGIIWISLSYKKTYTDLPCLISLTASPETSMDFARFCPCRIHHRPLSDLLVLQEDIYRSPFAGFCHCRILSDFPRSRWIISGRPTVAEFSPPSFLEGRDLWGIIDGTDKMPTTTELKEMAEWKTKNGKIVTWLLDSVDKSIAVGLTPHRTAKTMWDHLKKIYKQSNEARLYRLEQELTHISQGDRTIQEFYNAIVAIWTEISMMDPEILSDAIVTFQEMRERTQVRKFLMKMRHDFEHCRAALLNRSPLPSMNTMICDLLAEEQRLKAFIGVPQPPGSSEMVLLASSPAPGKRDMSRVQCYGCKQFGHLATTCRDSPICAFCKIRGHRIQECRKKKRAQGKVYMTTTDASSTSVIAPSPPSGPLTPEMVQQIVQALSAAGLSGTSLQSPWYFDSGASNHMTGTASYLHNVKSYKGNQIISTADGAQLPISSVGSLSFSPSPHRQFTLIDVFHVPKLSANLISVGQLVQNQCLVIFFPDCCFVHDLATGKVVGRGRRKGRLFLLDLDDSVSPHQEGAVSPPPPPAAPPEADPSIPEMDGNGILEMDLRFQSVSGSWVRCYAHILNLIVRDKLALIESTIENIRKSINWNLTYEMLDAAFEFRHAVPHFVEYDANYHWLPLAEDWSNADEGSDFDILQWWKSNNTRFRTLSRMTHDVLSIPITIVSSELAFSTGEWGRVITKYRSSLLPKTIEALICTNDWLRPSFDEGLSLALYDDVLEPESDADNG